MVQLKGKGSMTAVNLVVSVYDNAVTKDGKESVYADVQVDSRDARAEGQRNLHLRSVAAEKPDGTKGYAVTVPYSKSQFDKIVAAAGDNVTPLLNVAGEPVGRVLGLKASIMPSTRDNGLVINTAKDLGASEFAVDENTLDAQFASVKAASQAAAEAKAAQAAEPAAEAETVEPAAEQELVDEPAMG